MCALPLTTGSPLYAALIGLVVYVAVAVATVPLAAVTLAVSSVTGYRTREVTAGVTGVLGVFGVVGLGYGILTTSLETALTVGGFALAGVALLWGLPVAVGTGVLSRLTDTDSPLRYAVAGWPVATVAPLAYIRLFDPPSSDLLGVAVLAIPVVGTVVVGYAVSRVFDR